MEEPHCRPSALAAGHGPRLASSADACQKSPRWAGLSDHARNAPQRRLTTTALTPVGGLYPRGLEVHFTLCSPQNANLRPGLHPGSEPGDATAGIAGLCQKGWVHGDGGACRSHQQQKGYPATARRALETRSARKVDTVLVWKFDPFARSTKQLVEALEEFQHLGVDFISITEQVDTSSPMGKAMFTIISAIAEFERSLISERVRSGIARARAQGKRHGRRRIDDHVFAEIRRLRKQKQSLSAISNKVGVSRQTVANYSKSQGRGSYVSCQGKRGRRKTEPSRSHRKTA